MNAKGELGRTVFGSVLTLALAAAFVSHGTAQRSSATVKSVASDAQAKAATPSGPQEGIRVHGHWIIDVRNSNGTLASHTEFENALGSDGGLMLIKLLEGSATPGSMIIKLGGAGGPCGAGGQAVDCLIVEPTISLPVPAAVFPNLLKELVQGAVTLSGSATATYPGNVQQVSTLLYICSSSATPVQCEATGSSNGAVPGELTARTLQTPVSVAAGQIVQVTVLISFS